MRFNILASIVLLPTFVLCTPTPVDATSAVTNIVARTPLNPNAQTPDFSFNKLWTLTNKFWTAFMYPNNVKQALSINSTIFAADVLGRVDVSRQFNGRELNTEYIFGLFSALQENPHYFSLLGIPIDYNIIHFVACQNVVSVSVIVDFEFKLFGITAPVEIDVWLTYNKQQQISQYDATFRWLAWQFDWLLTQGEALLGASSEGVVVEKVTALLAQSICETSSLYCNGTNKQYSNDGECYNFLTEEIPFGSSYQLGMNTLLCRMVHQNMVSFRPDVHCSHIGPTGGAYCVDNIDYPTTITQSIFTNTPFVPMGYANSNETIAAM